MKIWRNRSNKAYCCQCKEQIHEKEPCILLDTIYFHKGARSCYLHLRCIPAFIKELRKITRKNAVKLLAWKVGE